jgi:hypothetical protein
MLLIMARGDQYEFEGFSPQKNGLMRFVMLKAKAYFLFTQRETTPGILIPPGIFLHLFTKPMAKGEQLDH